MLHKHIQHDVPKGFPEKVTIEIGFPRTSRTMFSLSCKSKNRIVGFVDRRPDKPIFINVLSTAPAASRCKLVRQHRNQLAD